MNALKKNIVWLSSYPKSGNTWVRLFLQNILGDNHEQEEIISLKDVPIASNRMLLDTNLGVNSSDLTQPEIRDYRPLIYKSLSEKAQGIQVFKVHDQFGTTSGGSFLFPKEISKIVIYIIRNPLDVVVSYSKHSGKPVQTVIDQLNNPSFEISINENELKTQVAQHLGTWSEHVISWTEQEEIPVYIIKYEDLLENDRSIFLNIIEKLDISIEKENFENALKAIEFDRLKEKEQAYGFREKPLQADSFFWQGRKDIYKEYLSNDQIAEIKKYHQRIMTKFGYLKEQE